MWKRIFAVIAIGLAGWAAYGAYLAGYHTRPKMPEGAFSVSFKSGFRAILQDIPNERLTRRYQGHPANVPYYIKDAWSFCEAPTEAYLENFNAENKLGPGQRLEAFCFVDVDGERVFRGRILTVPKL